MVAGPVKTFAARMMDLQRDPSVKLTAESLLKPALVAELDEINQARFEFAVYIQSLWSRLESRHQSKTEVMVLGSMIRRACMILDVLSLASGTKKVPGDSFGHASVSSGGTVTEVENGIKLPELPGSHCNLDVSPHVG